MLIFGANVTLVGDAGTTRGVEESLEESTSLSREINAYMDVRSFMQKVLGGPSSTAIREGSNNSRKRQRTTFGIGNIILSSKDKGTAIRELRRKKRRDRDGPSVEVTPTTTVLTTIPSPPIYPIASPPPPRLETGNVFGVINHGPLVVP